MRIEVIQTPECPHARPIIEAVERLAADQPGWEVRIQILDWDDVPPAGFSGSPTLLVDGRDPFNRPPVEAAACALHPPTVEAVTKALTNPTW